jgi:cobalt-zinc-cadmium efflux system membrane fusion protein
MAFLLIDTVRTRRTRTVAVVPAEIVMDEEHTVRVTTPVTGRIRALISAPGERVQAGSPLARILSGDLAQSQSDAARSTAQERLTAAALARARDLYAHNVISARELEGAESDAAQAAAEAARARARLRELGGDMGAGEGEYVLRAPIAGEVIERSANPGEEVRPDAQTPLFVISALDSVWITAQVAQSDLGAIRRGATLVFTSDGLAGERISARVSYVGNALDPLTRTVPVRAVVANPGHRLRPRMTGSVRLLEPNLGGGPVVPVEALVTRGEGLIVFIERAPGLYAATPVAIDEDDGEVASIASGVHVGDRIVTRGSLLLAAELDRSR